MSLKRVIEKLESIGLSKADAMVYVYLAKKGPKNGRDLSNDLGLTKQNLYFNLKKLREKKLVTTNDKRPSIFLCCCFR